MASSNSRHPSRLTEFIEGNTYYPRELVEKDGKLYLINEDSSKTILNPDSDLAFYVTFTGNKDDGYIADKTPKEIYDEYIKGRPIYAIGSIDSGTGKSKIVSLNTMLWNADNFYTIDFGDETVSDDSIINYGFSLSRFGESFEAKTTYWEFELNKFPNPQPLTINGTTYDGSEEVNIDLATTPNVTASDNGAFLRVVDGAWAAVQLPNAEEDSF